jgi:hypothetical protein
VASERRTEEEIRREIAGEREQLVDALADLRAGVAAKRRAAAVVGGALLTGLAALAVRRIARRRS